MTRSQVLGRLAQGEELPPDAHPAPVQLGLADHQPERCGRTLAVPDQADRVRHADRHRLVGCGNDSERRGLVAAEYGTVERAQVAKEGPEGGRALVVSLAGMARLP